MRLGARLQSGSLVGLDPQDLGKPRVVMTISDAASDGYFGFCWDLNPDGERFLVTTAAEPKAATRSPDRRSCGTSSELTCSVEFTIVSANMSGVP